jgi:hypothetical protein
MWKTEDGKEKMKILEIYIEASKAIIDMVPEK